MAINKVVIEGIKNIEYGKAFFAVLKNSNLSALEKKAAVLAKKRKAMKVPLISEQDLEIEHELKDIQGRTIMAKFVDAND